MIGKLFEIAVAFAFLTMIFLIATPHEINGKNREIEVKIYLQKTLLDPSETISTEVAFVMRKIDARSPLRSTLEMLFSPNITADEERQNFNTSTFGMRLEGVSLRKGTATVRFSQPPGATDYGSLGPMIFAEAVEKTALQFKSVKRVKICAVGETSIDSELVHPFPKCPV